MIRLEITVSRPYLLDLEAFDQFRTHLVGPHDCISLSHFLILYLKLI